MNENSAINIFSRIGGAYIGRNNISRKIPQEITPIARVQKESQEAGERAIEGQSGCLVTSIIEIEIKPMSNGKYYTIIESPTETVYMPEKETWIEAWDIAIEFIRRGLKK